MTSEASFSAREAFCSPSAAMTWGESIQFTEQIKIIHLNCYTQSIPLLLPPWQLRPLLPWPSAAELGDGRLCWNVLRKNTFNCAILVHTSCCGTHISTLSTLIPHAVVASSSTTCIEPEMLSLSLRISCRFFVPRMFLRVVCARSLVEWWAFSTLATDTVAFDTR